jgi:hypothetical protein
MKRRRRTRAMQGQMRRMVAEIGIVMVMIMLLLLMMLMIMMMLLLLLLKMLDRVR